MMCCSARPAFSGPPSVLPEDRIIRNVMYTALICDHVNFIEMFDRLPSLLSKAGFLQRARLIFNPPALSLFHPQRPPTSRWPALPSLPPFDDFKLVCRCLYEALPPSSSLVGQHHRRCCLVWSRTSEYKVLCEVNINTKPSTILSDTVGELIPTFEA